VLTISLPLRLPAGFRGSEGGQRVNGGLYYWENHAIFFCRNLETDKILTKTISRQPMKLKVFILHVMTSDFGTLQQPIKLFIYCIEVGLILTEVVEICVSSEM
jgi:hypothetical protein